jgi:WXXGXW repeat (2 copies)
LGIIRAHKKRSGQPALCEHREDRMQHFDLRVGATAAALGFIAFSACSTPPVTPGEASAADPVGSTAEIVSAAPARPSAEIIAEAIAAPRPPPPTRAEIPPPAPSPRALWQFGQWSWNGRQFVWSPGQYVERPSPTASWIPGYWEQRPEGWVRVDGQWV